MIDRPKDSAPYPSLSASSTNLLSFLLFSVWLIISLFLLFHSVLSIDEGFYLAASKFCSEGLHPYRDFAFSQPPLFPIIHARLLEIFGFDLLGMRLSSLLWNTIGTVSAYFFISAKFDKKTGVLFLTLLLLSPGWLVQSSKGTNYAFAALMTLLATCVFLSRQRSFKVWILYVLFSAFAVCTRYQTISLLLPFSLIFLSQVDSLRNCSVMLVLAASVALMTLFLCSMGDWQSIKFWTIDYHLSTELKINFSMKFEEFRNLSPVAVILLFPIIFQSIRVKGFRQNLLTSAIFLFAFSVNFFPKNAYGGYSAIFMPALICFVSSHFGETVGDLIRKIQTKIALLSAAIVLTVLATVLPHQVPLISGNTIADAFTSQEALKKITNPDDTVVAVAPEIVIGADRKLPTSLAFGAFSLTTCIDPSKAQRFNYLTIPELTNLLENNKTRALVLTTQPHLNFAISTPDMRQIEPQVREPVYESIKAHFQPVFSTEYYVIFERIEKPSKVN